MLTRRNLLRTGLAASLLATTRIPAFAQTMQTQEQSLDFNPDAYETLTTTITAAGGDVQVTYRFYRAIPYVSRPVDLAYQSLNISVPVEIGGAAVDAAHAPILLANSVGGYMPSSVADATGVGEAGMRGPTGAPAATGGSEAASGSNAMLSQGKKVSNAQLALAAGYVVVEPGARGRTLVDDGGVYYGTAPAAIVDLKAAVRWLRHNAGKLPGNTERIISSGTSAGGALSALLGAAGDRPEYLPYLAAIGAAETSDAIFATGAWCPITDLEHADMAYEWNWGSNPGEPGDPNSTMGNQIPAGGIDTALSAELAAGFAAYQASLGLEGQGGFGPLTAENYGDYLTQTYLKQEATTHLAALSETDRTAYLAANPNIAWDGAQADFTWAQFLAHVGPRKKNVPAFDALDLSSGENNLFGGGKTAARHFTEFSVHAANSDPALKVDADLADIIPMMNPMPALFDANPARSRHWWFRLGAKDTDTSLTVVGNLDALARKLGDNVSTRYYWDAGHGANEDAADFLSWIAAIGA
ncbi:MAG: subtype B tannase [Paracoccaceae bacterium]